MINKKKQAIIDAFEKGYMVINGDVYYKDKKRKLYLHFKKKGDNHPYYSFGVRSQKSRVQIYVHQLVAYQKYGDEFINNEKMIVNHRDDDTKNNREDNIFLVMPCDRTRTKKDKKCSSEKK